VSADRKLLELAAKAAGYSMKKHGPSTNGRQACLDTGVFWRPFDSDGDALRLAVKLDLLQSPRFLHERAVLMFTKNMPNLDATRRAFVVAAAAIGEAMP